MEFFSLCIMYIPYLTDMGLMGSALCSPLGFYCTPHWICHCQLDHEGAECILPNKCITFCCSKWSYSVTQMSQTEIRWCMVTARQVNRWGLMVSGPFSWYTVSLLMPIVQCFNARTYLNIAAGFSDSWQSCIPKGMMGTLSETMLPAIVTELSRNSQFKMHSGEIALMTWTSQSHDISLFGNHSNALCV